MNEGGGGGEKVKGEKGKDQKEESGSSRISLDPTEFPDEYE